MNENAVDALARHASSLQDRRMSLKTLGAAALVAATPLTAEGGKGGKKAKKKCKKQGGPCKDFGIPLCNFFVDPGPARDACIEESEACCTSLAKCQAPQFFQCIGELIEDIA